MVGGYGHIHERNDVHTRSLIASALLIGGALTGVATPAAQAAPAGQADCGNIQFKGSAAEASCANNTDHNVTAELWINCKPASPDQHTSAILAPGGNVTLRIDCPLPWDHAEGGAASVH